MGEKKAEQKTVCTVLLYEVECNVQKDCLRNTIKRTTATSKEHSQEGNNWTI